VFGGDAVFAKLDAKEFSATTKQVDLPTAMVDKIAHCQVSLVTDDKEFAKK
jgi:hypothetical protein